MRKLICIIITLFSFSISILGQTRTDAVKPSPTFRIAEAELLAQLCSLSPNDPKCRGRNPAQEMTDAYLEIIKDGSEANKLIAKAAERGITNLLMVIAAQNQRIIELLEQKKPE